MTVKAKLRDLLARGFVGTQGDICSALAKEGYQVHQSTVSRLLKRIGARKSPDGTYGLNLSVHPPAAMAVTPVVREVLANESVVVVKTHPGSANLVGSFLDHSAIPDVLGTLAGDDTLIVIPRSSRRAKALRDELRRILVT